jgi:glycosyltransferase involved in cell wall biosynthesis
MTQPQRNIRCVALLGQRDSPTDAVEEYCSYLATALLENGILLEVERVPWAEKGWKEALAELRIRAGREQNFHFFIQYTALAWSRRGFSWRVLSAIRVLKESGTSVAMVFHDVEPYYGERIVDRFRRFVQRYTMRQAVRLCDFSIFTVPVERIPWIAGLTEKTAFVPVGANLPAPERAWTKQALEPRRLPTIGMFAVSSGQLMQEEAKLIADIFSHVTRNLGEVRLAVLGRNSTAAEQVLREKLKGIPVEIVVHGILSGEEVVKVLGSCDAMLFLRGAISSRRGSAIAGIACGLPVIAVRGEETAAPVTEAGVVLLSAYAAEDLGPALVRVLKDQTYRSELAQRSRDAQRQYFCWQAIAASYARILEKLDGETKN